MSAALPTPSHGGGVQTVRRIITYSLLFVMVVIAAIGVSGLLGRLLEAGNPLLAGDTSGLAQSLSFALIAGPLALVLWWLVWRGLAHDRDRSSISWSLFLTLASTVALIVSTNALLSTGSSLVTGRWLGTEFATGIVWAGVWWWQHWMLGHQFKGPRRLRSFIPVIGSFYGLAIGVGGAVAAVGGVLTAATDTLANSQSIGVPWWQSALQSFIWAVGGAVIWWWYWEHGGTRMLHTGFARVVLVIITGFGAATLCLAGIATTLFVALRLAFDPSASFSERLDPLGIAVSAALVGALVWTYHRQVVAQDAVAVREASRLVTSGVSLAAAASGIGVIVNSVLAAIGTPLAETGLRALLLGGVSALLVGGPVWWASWRPLAQNDADQRTPGRRIYLVAVFGISALVALITLILIAFRLFELGLTDVSGQSTLDRVRAPLGLLTATVLVAGYHFAVWWRDRSTSGSAPAPVQAINQVILVTGADPEPLRRWIDATLGARVTVWTRSDGTSADFSDQQLEAALRDVTARRVLVVAGADRLEVIPLEE